MAMRYREIITETQVSDVVHRYVLAQYADLIQHYPMLAGFITGVKFSPATVNNEFDAFSKELRFSVAGMDQDVAQADHHVEAANKPGFVVGYGLRSLITHEFGHAVNDYIIVHADDATRDDWFDTKKQLENDLGPASPYAAKSSGEWFAEQFVAEMQGFRPKHLLPVIATFLVRVMSAPRKAVRRKRPLGG